MIELTNRAPIRSKESRIFFSGRGSSFLRVEIGKSHHQVIGKQLGLTQTNP